MVYVLITLLRVIPTMTFIHFLTGKSSGILSDISSGILSGISSGICSGISSGILSGKSSGILSGISSGILSDISSGVLSDIPSGISSGILSGRWGLAVPTGIWSSRLRSGSAHWDLELAVEVRRPLRPGSRVAVEVRQCPLRSATGIWTARRRRRVRRRRRRRWRRRRRTALIKSNNPHLAGGELCYIYIYTVHVYSISNSLGLKTKNTRGPDRLGGVEAHVKPNHLADHHASEAAKVGASHWANHWGCRWGVNGYCLIHVNSITNYEYHMVLSSIKTRVVLFLLSC